MKNILIIHGPNLNLLGEREPDLYGTQTLDDVNAMISEKAEELNVSCTFFQSNHEGAIIDTIHEHRLGIDGLIINPGAYTHTSVAIRDALTILDCPVYEVHLSNIHARENFRRRSFISPVAAGVICGCGAQGYLLALAMFAS